MLRDSQKHFPEECVSAFFWLVQRLGATAPHMSSMSLSMSVWAVGKLCLLENYALPVQGRRFKPSGMIREAHLSVSPAVGVLVQASPG